jgi:hypothetical protein
MDDNPSAFIDAVTVLVDASRSGAGLPDCAEALAGAKIECLSP